MGCQQSIHEVDSLTKPTNLNRTKIKKSLEILPKSSKKQKTTQKPIIQNNNSSQMVEIQKQFTGKDVIEIQKILSQHFIFFKLTKTQRVDVISSMKLYQMRTGSFIFKQGDNPSSFFIIKSGSVDLIINQQKTKILQQKQYFGELAFLYETQRSASVQVRETCKLWTLSKDNFEKVLQQMKVKNYSMAKKYLNRFAAFSYLSAPELDLLARNMAYLRFQQSQIIFNQGDAANSIFIIITGSVQLKFQGKPALNLRSGQFFGQGCLYDNNRQRRGTAKVLGHSYCLTISRKKIIKCLNGDLNNILHFCLAKWSLKRTQPFKNMSQVIIEKLVNTGIVRHIKDEESLIQAEEDKLQQSIEQIIICLEGKINQKGVGSVFNQKLYELHQKNKLNQNTSVYKKKLIKKEDGFVFFLPFKKIDSILGKVQLQRTSFYSYQLVNQRAIMSQEQFSDLTNIKLKELRVIRPIIKSKTNNIFLLVDRSRTTAKMNSEKIDINSSNSGLKKQKYVLKCIQKKQIVEKQLQHCFRNQKQLLQKNKNPFICDLIKTFKDEYFIYFLFKYYSNGDFFEILRQITHWDKSKVQFYAGCLLLSLKYLHSRNIVYRNLKPQNILVDQNGYLALYDFSKAKKLDSKNCYKTFTIIGTPHYMAPQVIQGKGYSFAVDVWSMGIIIYEILYGQLPFGAQSDDPYVIFKAIQFDELLFPKQLPDYQSRHIIQLMLNKDCQRRELLQFKMIQKMSFFKDFNWSQLSEKKMQAPYVKIIQQKEQKMLRDMSVIKYLQIQKKMLKRTKKSQKDAEWDEIF